MFISLIAFDPQCFIETEDREDTTQSKQTLSFTLSGNCCLFIIL